MIERGFYFEKNGLLLYCNSYYLLIDYYLCSIIFFFFGKCFQIPTCPVFEYLHFYCPACGATRAVLALLRFDILSSLYYNPFVLYLLIFSSIYLINEISFYTIHKKINFSYKWFVRIGLIILVANFVIKNLFRIEMLCILTFFLAK